MVGHLFANCAVLFGVCSGLFSVSLLAEPGACGSGTGACCEANGSPGCDDRGTGCCQLVCGCDGFCCEVEWDEDCATFGIHDQGCGAAVLCIECQDADGDGVLDIVDVCCHTPSGVSVDDFGRPLGDIDLDCDVDIDDHRILALNFTGVLIEDTLCESVGCESDGDCDDGLYCNGIELCTLQAGGGGGVCIPGIPPCDGECVCDEERDACVVDPDLPYLLDSPLQLTSGADFLEGGCGDDTFDGSREIIGGNFFQTLNDADSIDGAEGEDRLNVQFQGGGTTTPAALTSIEIIACEVTDAMSVTLDLLHADAVSKICHVASQASLVVTNVLTAPRDYDVFHTSHDLTVTIAAEALMAEDDGCTVRLHGVVDLGSSPVLTFQPSGIGGGYETITVVSEGTIPNSLDELSDGFGTSWTRLNVQGDQDFAIDGLLDSTVTQIDASSASGGVWLRLPAASHSITGGSGDDRFDMAGNFDVTDSLIGGPGIDTLASTSADLAGSTSDVTNVLSFETVCVTDVLAGDLNVTHFGASNAKLAGTDGIARTITIPDGGRVELTADAGANRDTIAVAMDSASSSCSIILNDADTASGILLTTFESVLLESTGTPDGGANVIGGGLTLNDAFTVDALTISGDAALVLTGHVRADVVDAGAFASRLTMTAGMTDASSITGGSDDDSLRGSTSADIIIGGEGHDTIRGDDGNDVLTGGSGQDIFNGDNGDSDEWLTVTDTITDFEAGTSNTTIDLFVYDISSIEATTGVTDLVDTSATSVVTSDATFVPLLADGASVANADLVGIIGDYADAASAFANRAGWTITYGAELSDNDAYLIAYTSGVHVRIAVAVNDGVGMTSDSIDNLFDIAILQDVSLNDFDSGDFAAQ